jgi:phosphatidylglycerophosphate synthase
MDPVPDRPRLAGAYRAVLSFWERHLHVPAINPAYYQVLGLGLSIAYLYTDVYWHRLLLLAIILLADWLDGAAARRQKREMRSGYVADVVVDRASEGLIFVAELPLFWGWLFFGLWLLNTVMTFYSMRTGNHRALPLRFLYMLVLIGLWMRA